MWQKANMQLSCSFGCTSGIGGRISADELIRVADEALYAAKRGGRDRAVGRDIVPTLSATAGIGNSLQDVMFEPNEAV